MNVWYLEASKLVMDNCTLHVVFQIEVQISEHYNTKDHNGKNKRLRCHEEQC